MLGKKFTSKIRKPDFLRALIFILSGTILYCFLPRTCGAAVVPSEEVWKCAEHLGFKYNIDPLLIFSIACAESSLDSRADSGKARGIMQMTPDAWAEVADTSFSDAWDWRENMEESVRYLQLLKRRLLADGAYSWPVLAAAYHYGLGKIEQAGYDLAKLPPSKNLIYARLFKGETPDDLPYPAPRRSIEEAPAAFRPDANLIMALSPSEYPNFPPLLDDSGEPIPENPSAKPSGEIALPELDKSENPAAKQEEIVLPNLETSAKSSGEEPDDVENRSAHQAAAASPNTAIPPLTPAEENPPREDNAATQAESVSPAAPQEDSGATRPETDQDATEAGK